MAMHPTAALSYGDPEPSYPVLRADTETPDQLAQALLAGKSVHVDLAASARDVLAALGLSPDQIDFRMRVAEGHSDPKSREFTQTAT